MSSNEKNGNKKAAVAAVVCFVAAIAITGMYTFNGYRNSMEEKELALAEETDFSEELSEETYTIVEKEVVEEDPAEEEPLEEIVEEESVSAQPEADKEIVESVSVSSAATVNFTEDSSILWPVTGDILLDYSMDKTVYFKTLDQYKYNPAMIIAAAENEKVIAGVKGLVKSIDNSAETGTTVNLDLGNGYEAFYGQLVNVQVEIGDYVEAESTLGNVAAPTKYYSSEGSNLYFEMRKDGRPVDPKEYLSEPSLE